MRFLTTCLFVLLGTAGSLRAGALLAVEVDAGRGGDVRSHEIRVQASQVRMDTPTDKYKQSVLYDNKAETLVVMDEERKSFRRIDLDQTMSRQKEMEEQQDKFREAIEKRIRSLPPEKQAAFRKRLNLRMTAGEAARMECRRVAEGETVGPWTAERYDCFVGSRKIREVWTVPWEQSGLSAEEAEALQGFVRRREGGGFGLPLGMNASELSFASKAHPGLAVRVRHIREGAASRGHEITSIKSVDIESALFVVDASFSEAEAGSFPLAIR